MKTKDITCTFCDKSRHGLFCSLDRDIQGRLDADKTVHHYGAGNILFHEGAAPLAIYCVHEGLVKLTKSTPEGRTIVIRLQGHGEVIGFRAVIANEPYAATAEVVEPSDICIIGANTFRTLLDQSSQFQTALIAKLARELRISEERMIDQIVLPARVRVARVLAYLTEHAASADEPQTIRTGLLRQDLADIVGVTPQTFSRILHEFNAEGMIRSSRTEIEIRDPRRLRAMIERRH